MIIKHEHPITGELDFVEVFGTVADRSDCVRKINYKDGDGNVLEGMIISLKVPCKVGNKEKNLPTDIACFIVDEFPKIVKLKLKSGMSVHVNAEKDAKGRLKIEEASDIEIRKDI